MDRGMIVGRYNFGNKNNPQAKESSINANIKIKKPRASPLGFFCAYTLLLKKVLFYIIMYLLSFPFRQRKGGIVWQKYLYHSFCLLRLV